MSVRKKGKPARKITYQGYSHGYTIIAVDEIENGLISQNQEDTVV